jgi:hypothetical protein
MGELTENPFAGTSSEMKRGLELLAFWTTGGFSAPRRLRPVRRTSKLSREDQVHAGCPRIGRVAQGRPRQCVEVLRHPGVLRHQAEPQAEVRCKPVFPHIVETFGNEHRRRCGDRSKPVAVGYIQRTGGWFRRKAVPRRLQAAA